MAKQLNKEIELYLKGKYQKGFVTPNLISNINKYIEFVNDIINIKENELDYIVYLQIISNFKLLKKDYINNNDYIKIFMNNYNRNYKFISRFTNIKKMNFTELITKIKTNKKRTYLYFEDINSTNISFYLPIIEYLEKTN